MFMSGWTIFKLASMENHLPAPPRNGNGYLFGIASPINPFRCDWELSNDMLISTEYLRANRAEDVMKTAYITGPRTNASFTARELCAVKENIEIKNDAFCLLDNCTVANLTKAEKQNLFRFLNITVNCE